MISTIIAEKIKKNERIVIELGCGPNKIAGAIGVDKYEGEAVDIIADIEKGLPFLPDNSVDELSSRHLLEHIENLELLIREIYRVLKPGGLHRVVVPHFSNPYFYSDYTHRRFLGREDGTYGPIPRRKLWGLLGMPFNRTAIRGLYCVGDSTFPGQGLNAVAFSGFACAHRIAVDLGIG